MQANKRTKEMLQFGERLCRARLQQGLSQEAFAEQIEKSSNTVSRYEIGESTMDIFTFEKSVNLLGITPYELLEGMELPKKDSMTALLFELQRLEKSKQQIVIQTMHTLITSLKMETSSSDV